MTDLISGFFLWHLIHMARMDELLGSVLTAWPGRKTQVLRAVVTRSDTIVDAL